MSGPTPGIDRLVRSARRAAAAPPAGIPGAPSTGVAVVACMDSRLDPFRIFGLAPGEAHVIRSAGGSVTDDVMRSVAASQWGLNTTEVLVLHHTGCGMAGVDDDEMAAVVEAETGAVPPFRFGGFSDVDDDVRDGMARIRSARYLRPGTVVRGFVYDLETGDLTEVDPA